MTPRDLEEGSRALVEIALVTFLDTRTPSRSGVARRTGEGVYSHADVKLKRDDEEGFAAPRRPGDPSKLKTRSTAKLSHHDLDVNYWAINVPDVEQARPSHCPGCEGSARKPTGRLRLQGHGLRTRTLWGRQEVEASPTLWEIVLRRYRCVDCGAVPTVAPRGVFTHFRYALGAIALALAWWAVVMLSPSEVRRRISPWPIVGLAEPERWRSLPRWSRRACELFRLDAAFPDAATLREDASRVARLLIARGPPSAQRLERAFIGAHAR